MHNNIKFIFMAITAIFLIQTTKLYSAGTTDTTLYMYVSLKGENAVSLYTIHPQTGVPTKVYTQAVSGGPASLAIHPSKKYLYVAQRTSNSISAYAINSSTGKLSLLNIISAVDNPVYISTDRTGKYLLSAYFNANKAAVYEINPDGTLVSTYIKSVSTGTNPHAILTDSSNKYLYITNMTGNKIQEFSFTETSGDFSTLTPGEIVPPTGTCPRHFVFHGKKNVVYVVNEVESSITCYHLNTLNGQLSSFQKISCLPAMFAGTNKSADIHITPDNKYLYATNRGHQSIAAFSINPDNDTLVSVGYYNTTVSPREFDIDPTGSFIYSAGETNGDLAYYKINKTTGQLDSISTIQVGAVPSWVSTIAIVNSQTSDKMVKESQYNTLKLTNYPNPFSSETYIQYYLNTSSKVLLEIFTLNGNLLTTLQNKMGNKGLNNFHWNLSDTTGKLKNGVYMCKLNTTTQSEKIKIIILNN